MEEITCKTLNDDNSSKTNFVVFRDNKKICGNSLSLFLFGQSCCFIDIFNSDCRLGNLNIAIKNTPKHSDVLVVSDVITNKMAPILRKVYDEMPFPKWVVAVGSCMGTRACSFNSSYSLVEAVETIVPVDIKVLGCPAKIETILNVFDFITTRDK